MAEPHFQHEHLRLSEGSIRLVQIHGSSSKTAPLSLRITQFATSKRPPYAAISYTWGSVGKTSPVTINGKPFHIRPNLWQLLFHLRQRGESRFLWVDALCINQSNDTERNFHVQFMSRIYEEAELAIVWLGIPSNDRREARAIDFLVEMAAHRPSRSAGASFRDLYLTEKAHPRWLNLLSFCRCTYWTRTWIIQEFVQAQRIEVLCGIARLDWSAFDAVHSVIKPLFQSNTLADSKALPFPLQSTLRTILSTIPSRLTARRLSHTASILQELLHEFYDAQCTLPRDKVYGMLGIAADCGQIATTNNYRGPVPDYAKHIVEVYFDVLIYLRDSSPTKSVAPLTVLLLQKSLAISEQAIAHYIVPLSSDSLALTLAQITLHLKPDYISTITATIPSYTSPSDLRQKLSTFDWSPYVGFEIVRLRTPTPTATRKTSLQRPSPVPSRSSASSISLHAQSSTPISSPSPLTTLTPPAASPHHRRNSSTSTLSRQITQTAPLPTDLIQNIISVAETSPLLTQLPIYPQPPTFSPEVLVEAFHLPLSLLNTNPHDKLISPSVKPTVIIESSPLASPVRIGFATPSVRRGDVILQFRGLGVTLVGRRVDNSSPLTLVGQAVMVTHSGLQNGANRFVREAEVHPACSGSSKYGGVRVQGEGGGSLRSPCLIPTFDDIPTLETISSGPNTETEADPKGQAYSGADEILIPTARISLTSDEPDQELTHHLSLWREHLSQHEDIEIETDALSLFEILRDT